MVTLLMQNILHQEQHFHAFRNESSASLIALVPQLLENIVRRLSQSFICLLQVKNGPHKAVIFPSEQHKHNDKGGDPPDRLYDYCNCEWDVVTEWGKGKE
jgi:hypothetical protein